MLGAKAWAASASGRALNARLVNTAFAIHSGGVGALAREFVAAREELRMTICALPAQADWLCRDLPDTIPDEQQLKALPNR